MSEDRKKIKLFQEHFAWVNTDFLFRFENATGIISVIQFIKESSYKDFGIYLNTKTDIQDFDKALSECGYKNKSEWLREKMRNLMDAMKSK